MGKKRRGHPDVEDLLARPWCYYCERDFEDLKLLISHQKAKHFRCERCGKRLNTAGGLSVHMNQVHKESLDKVENALPNRQGLDIEIFGMEGVPEEIAQQHNQRIIQNFYTAQAERHAQTGNAPRGHPGGQGPAKKIKMETAEELKARLAEHRAKRAAERAAAANGVPIAGAPVDGQSPAQGVSWPFTQDSPWEQHVQYNSYCHPQTPPFPPPQGGFPYAAPTVPGVPGTSGAPVFPPGQTYPPTFPSGPSPPPGAAGAFNLPQRPPGGAPAPTALPQRPPYWQGAPPAYPAGASTVDELVAGASRQGDDIDQLIRMAEAGIKPAKPATEDIGGEKKSKKDKMRMVYADTEVSPEEKMAMLPKYRFVET
ncbi:hypothetical protein OQA88_8075 [Cercophora sp. LCS_1]